MRLFRKAVVIIHGFTGNLYDNEYLMNYLEKDLSFDVYAETLPGHNQERFSKAHVEDWLNSVDNLINRLKEEGYHTIYVIGHSMGGVLACHAASCHREIKKIVLVNAAFDYFNLVQNKNDIKEKNISRYKLLWLKLLRTSPFMLNEFRKLIKQSDTVLNEVYCDALVLRSEKDEIVPYEVGDTIYEDLSSKKKYLTDIKEANHVPLKGDRKEVVSEYIELFLKGGRKWKKNVKKEI